MPRGFSLAAVTLAVLAAPFAAAADASPALSGRQTLSLPAQPLGQTLNALARQSGTAISVDAALIAGRRAPALQGTMTLGEALRQALAGSGLLATPAGTGISVHSGDRAGEVALPEVTVSASTGRSAVTEGKGSYTTGSMSTATRLPLSIRETPQAVTVMTRQQLNDQAMTSITDVVRNAPGLFLSTSNGPARFQRPRLQCRQCDVRRTAVQLPGLDRRRPGQYGDVRPGGNRAWCHRSGQWQRHAVGRHQSGTQTPDGGTEAQPDRQRRQLGQLPGRNRRVRQPE